MKYALALMAWLVPVHHNAPPPPPPVPIAPARPVVTTTTPAPPHDVAPAPAPLPQETTTTTQPPATAAAVDPPPPSWQVAWIVRCPPAQGVWYTYSGNLAQVQEIYNQQVALDGQESSPGCVYGSVSEPEQVTG